MTYEPRAQDGAFTARTPISAHELTALRSEVWAGGSVSLHEAEKLFARNRLVEPSREWTEFFVEAICDFMLSQGEPHGYVTEDEATWLLRIVNRDGRIGTLAELELIVKLIERAEYAPASLRRFALGALEQTVMSGEGPTRCPEGAKTPRIDAAEASLIRRLVFAPASDGEARVSAAEAEMLFRLKNAALGQQNSPEWKKLFVQGVANYLNLSSTRTPASIPDALELHNSYAPRRTSEGFGKGFEEPMGDSHGKLSSPGQNWVDRLYDKHRPRDEYEQALLDFLTEDRSRRF